MSDAVEHFDVYAATLTDEWLRFRFSRVTLDPPMKMRLDPSVPYFNGYTYTTVAHGWDECRAHAPTDEELVWTSVDALTIPDSVVE